MNRDFNTNRPSASPRSKNRQRTIAFVAGVVFYLSAVVPCAFAQPAPTDSITESGVDKPIDFDIGHVTLSLPPSWEPGTISEVKLPAIVPVPSYSTTLLGTDPRVRMHVFLIDPLGLDVTWPIKDALAPVLSTLLEQSGVPPNQLNTFHTFDCEVAGEKSPGRIVNIVLKDQQRLLSGVACGFSTAERWIAFFIIIDADHQRPLLLKQTMLEAVDIMRSFHVKNH